MNTKLLITAIILACASILPSQAAMQPSTRPLAAKALNTIEAGTPPQSPEAAVAAFRSRMADSRAAVPGRKAAKQQSQAPTVVEMPPASYISYIYAPDGSMWYVTAQFTYRDLMADNPEAVYTDYSLTSYTYTLYDSNMSYLGEVSGTCDIDPEQGITRIASVDLFPCLTRKFLSFSDTYELYVVLIMNTSQYVNRYQTIAFNLGTTEPMATFDGWPVDILNASPDPWSNVYYLTILNEVEPEVETYEGRYNYYDLVYDIYQPASYYTPDRTCMLTRSIRVPEVLLPESESMGFISTVADNKPYFAFSYLKRPLFAGEPWDFTNTGLLPDNEFIIDLYTVTKNYPSTIDDPVTTRLPMSNPPTADEPYYVYSIGLFSYGDDITFGRYTAPGTPAYIITVENHLSLEKYNYTYQVIDQSGEVLGTIAEGVDTGFFLNEIPGKPSQIMFVNTGDGDNVTFSFVDYVNFRTEFTLPLIIGDYPLNTQIDRVPWPDSDEGYLYLCSMAEADYDAEGNTIHNIVYFTPAGDLHHVDKLNLGKNVMMALAQYSGEFVGPFIYNTDSDFEYALLVKRLKSANSSATTEEVVVVNTSGRTLLRLTPDSQRGSLANVLFVNNDGDRKLWVTWGNDDVYTSTLYPLPLESFAAGGDGTAENPYIITTAGDLQQIRADLKAHYRLGADIDGATIDFSPIEGTFTGSLNGDGHILHRFDITGPGLFESTMGASITNMWLTDCSLTTAAQEPSGLIAGSIYNTVLREVHASDVTLRDASNATMGGLVGHADGFSVIELSSVRRADIQAVRSSATYSPNETGGIVGKTSNNGSFVTIHACSFDGSIHGVTSVGGIIASLNGRTTRVVDCHVNADIVAENTIGGIAATSGRSIIDNCLVEGSIKATSNPAQYDWQTCGPITGGILGYLVKFDEENSDPEPEPVIARCVVALDSFKGFTPTAEQLANRSYDSQFDTMHRIVGFSLAQEPEMTFDEMWNPIYGACSPEPNIADNYAVGQPVNSEIEATAASTEGATIAAADRALAFDTLHWAEGTTSAAPWQMAAAPYLYFEDQIAMAWPTADLYVHKGESVIVTLLVAGARDLDRDLQLTVADDKVFAITAPVEMVATQCFVQLECLTEGVTTLTATCGTYTATITLHGLPDAGSAADAVAPAAPVITYAGGIVAAQGCSIALYDTMGRRMASNLGSIDTAPIAPGVYVAVATDTDGRTATLKIAVGN